MAKKMLFGALALKKRATALSSQNISLESDNIPRYNDSAITTAFVHCHLSRKPDEDFVLQTTGWLCLFQVLKFESWEERDRYRQAQPHERCIIVPGYKMTLRLSCALLTVPFHSSEEAQRASDLIGHAYAEAIDWLARYAPNVRAWDKYRIG